MRQTKYILLISLVAASGGLLFGFDTAVISGVLPLLNAHFGLDNLMSGWIVSILTVGCIIGVVFSALLTDRYGRKKLLYLASIMFLLSAFGTAFSSNIYVFQIFRFLGGLAVGIASVASPMYIAEVAPAKMRGRMVSINQLTLVTGILIAFFTNYVLIGTGENNWRWMLLIMAIPSLFFFIMLFTVPESPRWLINVGRVAEGQEVLRKSLGKEMVDEEFNEIERVSNLNKERISFFNLLKSGTRATVIIGIVLAVLQQITGINTIMYYAPVIFHSLGFSLDSALFQTVLIGGINFIFTIASMFLIDKIGRKPLLLIGSGAMATSLAILVYLVKHSIGGYWVLICILTYIAAFAISLGPVTWVLISEIFPNKYRGLGMSVSTMFLWIASFLIALFFPSILSALGVANTFLLFMIICLGAFFFYLFFVVETKNVKLEDIE